MHSKDARAAGETEQRRWTSSTRRGARPAVYSERERAALAWTEALTRVTEGVSDEVYAEVRAESSEKELAYLTSAVSFDFNVLENSCGGRPRRCRRVQAGVRAAAS